MLRRRDSDCAFGARVIPYSQLFEPRPVASQGRINNSLGTLMGLESVPLQSNSVLATPRNGRNGKLLKNGVHPAQNRELRPWSSRYGVLNNSRQGGISPRTAEMAWQVVPAVVGGAFGAGCEFRAGT